MHTNDRLASEARPVAITNPWRFFEKLCLLWERPLGAAALALLVYTALAWNNGPLWRTSTFPYYNYLADAFLHGQLHLRLLPPSVHDLSLFQGRYYLYWSPFPALLLMPLVALFGVGVSDIIITLALGALNVLLVALLLRQACRAGILDLSPIQRGLLTLFFALGSVHVTLAPYGRVWFTGQLVAFLCVVLAYLAAIALRGWIAFVLAGLAIAGAMLTRNHVLLAGVWPACYLLMRHRDAPWRRLAIYALLGLLPIVGAVALLGAYNWLRFGDPLDNGLDYHRMSAMFRADYRRYGLLHPYYLPTNLYHQYVAYPLPLDPPGLMGGSLFLLSPVFCAFLWGVVHGRPRWLALVLLATVLLVATPIALLMGTGWVQFGPRYTLDFTVPLLLLTALGVQRWPTWLLALLTILSVAQYLIGTVMFAAYV